MEAYRELPEGARQQGKFSMIYGFGAENSSTKVGRVLREGAALMHRA